MKKSLALFNLLSVVLVIAVNYVSQIIEFNGVTIGEMSRRYDNLFTPSGYAFSIWGVIFLLLLAYGIYQLRIAFSENDNSQFIIQTGPWFIITNLLNCTWVIVFAYDYTGMSVLVMLGILFSLVKVILNTNMEPTSSRPVTRVFLLWPIGVYSGWISVATIANIAAYFSKIGWQGGIFSESSWCLIMIVIAIVLNMIMVQTRNMKDFGLVGIWALFAIYNRHKLDAETIAYTAITGCAIILISILANAFKNRKTRLLAKSK